MSVRSKKLIVVGNSLALVIERPLLRALHYSRKTSFNLWTDGQRLILEPEPEPEPNSEPKSESKREPGEDPKNPAAAPLDVRRAGAMKTCRELMYLGLNAERMESLGAGYTWPRTYYEHLELRKTADPVLEMMMDRLEHVYRAFKETRDWKVAIEGACSAVPEVPGAGDLGVQYESLRGRPEYAHLTSHARRS
jgi:hypothetical protein